MMTTGLFELAALVVLAAVLGVAARLLKQPVMLAYLVTGAVVGYFRFFNLGDAGTFRLFSDLGIMFLLFLVGLEVNYTSLRTVGKASALIGAGQAVFTAAAGFGIARLFGFAATHALYIAVALTFSSTIIVVKLLSEKRDLNSLYGKISVGILLVQDFIAIVILVLLSGVQAGEGVNPLALLVVFVKGAVLLGLMVWLGRAALPAVFDRVARHQELLFLITLAWLFLVVALVSRIGFSLEIGGLLAGLALANSSEHFQIASRVRPLRDFFILMFFVILGSSFVLADFGGLALPIAVFSLFVLAGNPLIVFLIMAAMGYKSRTSFMTGVTMAQISEFSLVLVAMGLKIGHLNEAAVSVVTAVGIITIMLSTYLITHADWMFLRMKRFLKRFERRPAARENGFDEMFEKPFILIGANRVGESIARHLPSEDLLVIDFDPEVIARLAKRGVAHIFGDIADPEVFERANFSAARIVISTSPDLADNLHLLETLNLLPRRPRAIVRGESEADADVLYEAGADYVLLPHTTSGQYLGKTLAVDPEMRVLEGLRASDMEMMEGRR